MEGLWTVVEREGGREERLIGDEGGMVEELKEEMVFDGVRGAEGGGGGNRIWFNGSGGSGVIKGAGLTM